MHKLEMYTSFHNIFIHWKLGNGWLILTADIMNVFLKVVIESGVVPSLIPLLSHAEIKLQVTDS